MDKRLTLFILFICASTFVYSQDFKFKWQVWPSFRKAYNVLIEKGDTKSYIIIKETGSSSSIRKKIDQGDCDTLISFLDKYDFPIKGSTIYGPKIKKYFDTKILPDTNWIEINGDSIRRELIWTHEYAFDKDSNKCYTETQRVDTWTDGNTYEGEYIKSNIKKTFSVYCARISPMDFKLNKMVYNLIKKYDRKNDYSQLKEIIDADKPRYYN